MNPDNPAKPGSLIQAWHYIEQLEASNVALVRSLKESTDTIAACNRLNTDLLAEVRRRDFLEKGAALNAGEDFGFIGQAFMLGAEPEKGPHTPS